MPDNPSCASCDGLIPPAERQPVRDAVRRDVDVLAGRGRGQRLAPAARPHLHRRRQEGLARTGSVPGRGGRVGRGGRGGERREGREKEEGSEDGVGKDR